jgi:eukaryotic-like serine/threonine-protein kinase
MSSESSQKLIRISQGTARSKARKDFFEFGPFRVDPYQRLLLRNNQTIPLQPKAFDTLLVLVQNSGKVVLKEDLIKTVWPDTFVEESNLTQNIFVLRKILEEPAGDRRYIVTVPGRGYRFAEDVRTVSKEEAIAEKAAAPVLIPEAPLLIPEAPLLIKDTRGKTYRINWRVALPAIAAVLALAAGGFWFFRPTAPKLTEKDTVVLADFANMTGDPVFDGPLRRGLAAQLEQSPFVNLLSDQRIAQTLTLMARPRDTRLTPELAREVCLRTDSAAFLTGVIGQVGARYQLTLNAVACANGESLANAEAQAVDKNHVLDALGKTASAIRSKLGESLASVQKYDAPTESVTTPLLEALQAYNLGYQAMIVKGDGVAAIPLFQRAVDLDSNFAMAYGRLGTVYFNFDQANRATENLQKAYDLRGRVSERERFYIDAHYADIVTRDFEAARKVYELWERIYPRDESAPGNLAVIDGFLGYYDKGLAAFQVAHKLNPGNGNVLNNIPIVLVQLNRLEDAKAALHEAESLHPDYPGTHSLRYTIDFLEHDAQEMEKEAGILMGTLPAIRAAAWLRSNPQKAIETLAVSTPYEFGQTTQLVVFCLYPVYLRGEAYLAAGQGAAAAAEFQKILDRPGVIQNETIGPLAHLGLGRAYALVGDSAKAKTAYQDFFALWKNADLDIPILLEAKAEYAKLK